VKSPKNYSSTCVLDFPAYLRKLILSYVVWLFVSVSVLVAVGAVLAVVGAILLLVSICLIIGAAKVSDAFTLSTMWPFSSKEPILG
jgi:hypothetical protein